jgi:hypothetical protein
MKLLNNNKRLQTQGKLSSPLKIDLNIFYFRSITTANYIPRFSENDYVANGWIKTEPDVISLTQTNLDIDTSPKQHDRSWSANSTRNQTT